MLRALTREEYDSWEEVLPQALFALRTSVCKSTKLTPYQILFGRDVSQPIDLIFGNPYQQQFEATEPTEYAANVKRRIQRANQYVRENLQEAVRRQRRQYHQDRHTFKAGTKVWLFTPPNLPNISTKLQRFWTGPWTICNDYINDVMVRIAPHSSWRNCTSKVVSIDRLKPYQSNEITHWTTAQSKHCASSRTNDIRRLVRRFFIIVRSGPKAEYRSTKITYNYAKSSPPTPRTSNWQTTFNFGVQKTWNATNAKTPINTLREGKNKAI